jgi:hypothetical protein
MHAAETSLEPPRPRLPPYPEDLPLIDLVMDRARAGGTNSSTVHGIGSALTLFSAWLQQVHKRGIHDRVFDADLTADVWKF